ncbi:Serine endoprotease DegS [Zhongshania aliphaticivorans]|uniref:Serine endoprotease DegS n=1 Tax=Zhongshania aliphaticivorans TaxID=1470434 RepID=A0A5S9N0U3_9GAMM|nr:trypsin-like peptidase domain-containing protein [Zhongshania aliphaticivorans]CAA0083330.1 Serine endoprotease DegS [Zhongshania aliphaticivorans]CAA0083452.1 Serine endoprotease DegS [Zhongshania aliphaticivorans]
MTRHSLKTFIWPTVCGILLGICILAYLPGQRDNDYTYAVEHAAPAVANIYTTKVVEQRHPLADDPLFKHFFSRNGRVKQQLERSLGSGVIVSDAGYLLTNYHVIKGADEILVLLHDGRQALASVIGSDADTDLAVLKIDLDNLTSISIGDPGKIHVGNIVLAIGNPYGFGQTVTQGIVSAIGRYGLGLSQFENFIQTDAAINPGNSGGALIDTKGRLLGINTAIYTQSGGSTGIGLAIPTDLALRTMSDLISYGRPLRGWLGIEVQPVGVGTNGVVITALATSGPAEKAGLKIGDVLININGEQVGDGHAGMKLITYTRPGERVKIALLRGEEQLTIETEVSMRPSS